MVKILKLIISITFIQIAGLIGGIFTKMSVDTWYQTLNKPFFNPPAWLFSPVWITLYFIMGISFFLVWDSSLEKNRKKKALGFFLFQLIFNVAWSAVFFGLQNILLSFIVIIILWLLILLTIKEFYRGVKFAAYLFIPYFIWVSFAILLNLSILVLN